MKIRFLVAGATIVAAVSVASVCVAFVTSFPPWATVITIIGVTIAACAGALAALYEEAVGKGQGQKG